MHHAFILIFVFSLSCFGDKSMMREKYEDNFNEKRKQRNAKRKWCFVACKIDGLRMIWWMIWRRFLGVLMWHDGLTGILNGLRLNIFYKYLKLSVLLPEFFKSSASFQSEILLYFNLNQKLFKLWVIFSRIFEAKRHVTWIR